MSFFSWLKSGWFEPPTKEHFVKLTIHFEDLDGNNYTANSPWIRDSGIRCSAEEWCSMDITKHKIISFQPKEGEKIYFPLSAIKKYWFTINEERTFWTDLEREGKMFKIEFSNNDLEELEKISLNKYNQEENQNE